MILLILAATAAAVAAMPAFIAVPSEQIAFVDLSSLHVRRVPRQTLVPPAPQQIPQSLYNQDYQPILQQYQQQPVPLVAIENEPQVRLVQAPVSQQQQQQDTSETANHEVSQQLAERPPDFGEYVDFGAHTGDNGAFGWYADYPVNNHDDSGYRK